ncbi:MAG: GMC family oxidoreductase N-terminal domain-containing protein [Candidatus Dormibacteraeota bacterium]|nr:GMC family oxidoreductase N-terminal domain-containing protein [Candidatus Dormibacteraeota bacterium]
MSQFAPSEPSLEFDYVVVGGGTAGCVVASRLTEDGRSKVLLLEAGGSDRKLKFMIPASVLQLQLTSEHDWAYPAEPDPTRNDRADGWASGKVLGGSGSINGMVWVRGHPADYDQWSEQGCEGWDYATVLEHFRRSESYASGGDDRYRGRSGPVAVCENRFSHPLTSAFVQAAQSAGHELNDDYNGEHQEGVGRTQLNIGKGLRSSTSRTYLKQARGRRNLELALSAQATRVLVEAGRAVGVEYRVGGATRRVRARREVLVCAGSLASPNLLMLSGIGPAGHLRQVGIEVVHDSAGVGRNLSDHIAASLVFEVNVRSLNTYFTPGRMLRGGVEWLLFRRGLLATGPAHASVHGHLGASRASDYEIHLLPFALSGLEKGRSVSKLVGGWMRFSGMTLVLLGLHPRARGEVRLRSADPDDPPVIRHSQFDDSSDLALMAGAARKARRIAEQPALGRHVVRETVPGPSVQSDEEWAAFFRSHSHRGLHPTGTCAMGPGPDSVVDPQLRVRGVDRLRVIDASVMPTMTSGNINAAVVMVAERGAALVHSGR